MTRNGVATRQRRTNAGAKSPGEELFLIHCKAFNLPTPVREFRFHPKRKWRTDFAWPDLKLMVEVEGGGPRGRHCRVVGFEKDCEKYNAAVVLGWRVLRFTTRQVKSALAINTAAKFFPDLTGAVSVD